MNGASASRARRRAISVLPTPVGPIIRMFFGVISWRSGSATCCRRQRLRSAIATARFARSWPTMCLSSSWTISCGVMLLIGSLQHLDRALLVRVDADVGGDGERALDDLARRKLGVAVQRKRRGLRIRPARADRDDSLLGLEHVADAGDHERALAIGDREHRFEPPQDPVGAPVLCELDRRTHQVALVLVELRLEALEQRERIRGAAGEAGEDAIVIQAPHLPCTAFDYNLAERDLAVAAERYARSAAHGQDRRAVPLLHEIEPPGGESILDRPGARPEREKDYAERGHRADNQRSRRQVGSERHGESGRITERAEHVARS